MTMLFKYLLESTGYTENIQADQVPYAKFTVPMPAVSIKVPPVISGPVPLLFGNCCAGISALNSKHLSTGVGYCIYIMKI